ncbi:MAG TPA: aldo/keto reductase [Terriglobia bacterium]|nr:aldo/keto reductase [Terriglobia bacterium]
MKRRHFFQCAAAGLGAAWLAPKTWAWPAVPLPGKFSASDIVTLGRTGIKTSRLACGTGTVGSGHHSHQSALGVDGLADLLWNGYDHGLRFFDTADSYGTHPHVARALKRLPREKVTVLTKSWKRDAEGVRDDIDRFRKELDTDYLDILLMHCLTEENWAEKYQGAMEAISEAQEKGMIRAHGCSCHSIEALRTAARSPWVQVILSRVNPIGSHMDADPDTVVSVLREGRANGKAIIGMKILGQGDLRNRQDEALRYALSLDLLHAFTIGAENRAEQEDLIRRIQAVGA